MPAPTYTFNMGEDASLIHCVSGALEYMDEQRTTRLMRGVADRIGRELGVR